MRKISEMMRDHNLSIVRQGDEETIVVSNYLRELFLIMDQQSLADPIEFWEVEVQGAYFEVANFLAAVNRTVKTIIPIGITMESESPGSSRKNWTIVFVI